MDNNKNMVSVKDRCIPVVVEKTAFEGVKKIALKSARDMEMVMGTCPQVLDSYKGNDEIILYATAGRSQLLTELQQSGKIDLSIINGHREVYGIYFVENPFECVKKALVVAGSDKRGTIYGIFTLSEKIGVSPLVYWGDAFVKCTGSITFNKGMEEISKEPSVCYRGFFINDEWPCFGNWAEKHFGGFCADMYDHVFELLLRLKGNYLWPAMWSSSFALDGPGSLNEELADEYGIIMGNSHHEPCLRAGEEWDIYKKDIPKYGTEWNYSSNKEGLLEFWKDGLIRSGKYENIITMGMRGERDSVMQGAGSLEESIGLWKEIITEQDKLICTYADTEEYRHPRLLVIYKETEEYFYGTDEVQGLENWEGLEDKILMFCEDNYGYMRRLPDKAVQNHKGGLGMYYHLDYHGSPVSYEWVNTTQLTKIWEQMSQAYNHGIHEAWIVNAGDIKGNELPLSYFMALAYDFEKWGARNINSPDEFMAEWLRSQFGGFIEENLILRLRDIVNENINIISMRKPESLNNMVYHPCNYCEADRMVTRINSLLKETAAIKKELPTVCHNTFYSIIEYPLVTGMNTILMNLYSGKNGFYAKQGKVYANKYRNLVTKTFYNDKLYREEFARFNGGKWQGMELGQHTGFIKWNDDGCRLPVRCTVEPLQQAQLIVSVPDSEITAVKNYGTPDRIEIKDFLYPGIKCVKILISNGGKEGFECSIRQRESCKWIKTSWDKKMVNVQKTLVISCNTTKLPGLPEKHTIYITGAGAEVAVDIWGQKINLSGFPKGTFFERNGYVSMPAPYVSYITEGNGKKWELLSNYGKIGSAYKVFPSNNTKSKKTAVLGYNFVVMEAGWYYLEIWSAPSNPVSQESRISFGLSLNNKDYGGLPSVRRSFQAGNPDNEEWADAVLNQCRRTDIKVNLNQGINKIEIYASSDEFVLEGLFISREHLKESYTGPEASYCK
ncbi:MAG: hypothetical protein HFH68_12120 [Lachnospiraceae bacterium]|nr:hypothetical protein [Lachnospiraceae bacterium]